MLKGKSLFDFRTEQQFKNIDFNKSDTLTKEEVKKFIYESIDGEIDEQHLEEDLKAWDKLDLNKDGVFDINEFKLIYREMILHQLGLDRPQYENEFKE